MTERPSSPMGVSWNERSSRRYLAIAAGEAYSFLNSTQCEFESIPTLFNVTVDIGNLNITIRPVTTTRDCNPQRNITRTVVRQFELISNDMTNLYVSLLGEAFNSSIAACKMSRASASRDPFLEEEATLAGLTNSITAMADDMLVAYASAQLMVGRRFTQQPAKVYVYALQFGQPAYIYAIFSLNLLIILAVVFEAVRTVGWSSLGRFNYLDLRDLIIAASRGGAEIAEAADQVMVSRDDKHTKHVWLLSDPNEGNGSLLVNLRGDQDGHVKIIVAGADKTDQKVTSFGDGYGLDEKRSDEKRSGEKRSGEKRSGFSFADKQPTKISKKMKVGIFGALWRKGHG